MFANLKARTQKKHLQAIGFGAAHAGLSGGADRAASASCMACTLGVVAGGALAAFGIAMFKSVPPAKSP